MKFPMDEEKKDPETETELNSILEHPPTTTEDETTVVEVTPEKGNRGTLGQETPWEGGWSNPVHTWEVTKPPKIPQNSHFNGV